MFVKVKFYFLISFVTVVLISSVSFAQENETIIDRDDVPEVVLEKFKVEYPEAEIKNYKLVDLYSNQFYKFEVEHKNTYKEILFVGDGRVYLTKVQIPADEIPDKPFYKLLKEYPDLKIKKVFRINQGMTENYDVTLKSDDKFYNIMISKNGYIAKQEEVKEKEIKDKKMKTAK